MKFLLISVHCSKIVPHALFIVYCFILIFFNLFYQYYQAPLYALYCSDNNVNAEIIILTLV